MAEASSRPFYAPSSGFEVVDLLDALRPATVQLLPSRSYVDDDDDGDGSTVVVLDRLLAGVPTEDRRWTWHHSIAQILAALEDLRSLTIRGVALPTELLGGVAERSLGLRSLTLTSCALTDEGAVAVVDRLPALEELDLADNDLTAATALAVAERLRGVRTLVLRGTDVEWAGVRAIGRWLSNLEQLDLGGSVVGDTGAALLASRCDRLTGLGLVGCDIGPSGLRKVADARPALTELELAGNRLGDEGAALLARFPSLRSLGVRDNQIGPAGATCLADLDLESLDLGGNHIGSEGAGAIGRRLVTLTQLRLDANDIGSAGAAAVGGLQGLRDLDLRSNRIDNAGAVALGTGLQLLHSLDLAHNEIGDRGVRALAAGFRGHLTRLSLPLNPVGPDGAGEITRMPGLRHLHLSYTDIGRDGAVAVARGRYRLSTLGLARCGVDDDGARTIARFQTELTSLALDENPIGAPAALALAKELPYLQSLDLSGCPLGDLGTQALVGAATPHLTSLHLRQCGVGDEGARAIVEGLPRLHGLDLEDNHIGVDGLRAVLDAFADDPRPDPGPLGLGDNPGVEDLALPELVNAGDVRAMSAAYRRLRDTRVEDTVAFGEAKLVVLGNEAVGKTSLVRALVEGTRSDPDELRTWGVNHRIWVTPWKLAGEGETAQLNIWDFGGQEILHQTHRSFLTERCIHLVVLDRRKQDDQSVHTWLQTVAARAPRSPVVIVVNKCDDGRPANLDVDFERLRRDHPEVVDVFHVSCSPTTGTVDGSMAPLRACLERLVADDERLSSVRTRVPAAWVRVRDAVRARAEESQVLGIDEYVNICRDGDTAAQRVTDPDDQRGLLRLLHQIGTVVAHGLAADTATLSGLTLLDPNWFTDAIYALLDYGVAEFDRDDLGRRLRRDPDRAALYGDDRLDYIVDLLQQPAFALAFRLPGDADPPRYLLPEALTPTAPASIAGWDAGSLRFRFRYEQLPRGLLPQFQVRSHDHAGPDPDRWRSGCTLMVHGCPVLVDGRPAEHRVDLLVAGPAEHRRDALAVVRSLFGLVHERLPESAPEERVPLPDDPEVDVSFAHLRQLEAAYGRGYEFLPEGARHGYRVGDLLTGVEPRYGAAEPVTAPGGDGRVGRGADGAQVGGAVGSAAGVAAAAFYLLGRGGAWPVETVLAGGAAGGIVGALTGLGVMLRRR